MRARSLWRLAAVLALLLAFALPAHGQDVTSVDAPDVARPVYIPIADDGSAELRYFYQYPIRVPVPNPAPIYTAPAAIVDNWSHPEGHTRIWFYMNNAAVTDARCRYLPVDEGCVENVAYYNSWGSFRTYIPDAQTGGIDPVYSWHARLAPTSPSGLVVEAGLRSTLNTYCISQADALKAWMNASAYVVVVQLNRRAIWQYWLETDCWDAIRLNQYRLRMDYVNPVNAASLPGVSQPWSPLFVPKP